MTITVDPAGPDQASLLGNLLELYVHDLSDVFPIELGPDGRFGYQDLPRYWQEPDRRFAFIVRTDRDPLGFVLATPCALAIVNQEDLTGETEQQNLPASTWQHPNWRRKMKVAVEELGPIAEDLRRRLERSGRV